MNGFDFFMACYRKGVDLPVRIFADTRAPMNFYRPESVCFINLEIDDDHSPEHLSLMQGMDVSIIADEPSEKIRKLASALLQVRPKHLWVCAGITQASWAPHRGWK